MKNVNFILLACYFFILILIIIKIPHMVVLFIMLGIILSLFISVFILIYIDNKNKEKNNIIEDKPKLRVKFDKDFKQELNYNEWTYHIRISWLKS